MAGFMKPEIFYGRYYEVSVDHGATSYVPVGVAPKAKTNGDLEDYVEGKVDDPDEPVTVGKGWIARLSAPGYLDCTDWSVHATEQEAEEHLREQYDLDDEDDDPKFPVLYAMAPIGKDDALEAIEAFHFCSVDCRSAFHLKTPVKCYAGCTIDAKCLVSIVPCGCVCEECGKPL